MFLSGVQFHGNDFQLSPPTFRFDDQKQRGILNDQFHGMSNAFYDASRLGTYRFVRHLSAMFGTKWLPIALCQSCLKTEAFL